MQNESIWSTLKKYHENSVILIRKFYLKSLLCCVFIKCIQFKKDNSSHLQWPTLHTQPTANWQQTRRRDNTVYRR